MNRRAVASEQMQDPYFLIHRTALLTLLIWVSTGMLAQNSGGQTSSAAASETNVTHVLGFEGTSNNAKGKLSIQGSAVQFQKGADTAAQVNISSIQDVILGEQSKQLGGLPMTLGKAATPYGGGRVISLFAHKKYDTLTLVYFDTNGGLHGAIFQLNKGRGQAIRDELVAKGAHVTPAEDEPAKQSTPEAKSENK
jgi:hypothetical protein